MTETIKWGAGTPGPWELNYDACNECHVIRMGEAVDTPWSYASHLVVEYDHKISPEEGDGNQFREADANARAIAEVPALVHFVRQISDGYRDKAIGSVERLIGETACAILARIDGEVIA